MLQKLHIKRLIKTRRPRVGVWKSGGESAYGLASFRDCGASRAAVESRNPERNPKIGRLMPRTLSLLLRQQPANGVSARPVPRQLAPERCIGYERPLSAHELTIVGMDLEGNVRIRVSIARDDHSHWLVKVIRHWLAWWCGASEIKVVS